MAGRVRKNALGNCISEQHSVECSLRESSVRTFLFQIASMSAEFSANEDDDIKVSSDGRTCSSRSDVPKVRKPKEDENLNTLENGKSATVKPK